MDPLLSTFILILVALLGARFSFSTRSIPAGPRLLFRTGIHFIVLGYALGPRGLGILTAEELPQLFPLLGIALGWVGLLFGMQLHREALRQFPLRYLFVTILQATGTFFMVWASVLYAMEAAGLEGDVFGFLAVAAAATASMSTPAAVAIVSSNFMARGELLKLLFFVASLDAVVGITALQVAHGLHAPGELVMGAASFGLATSLASAILVGLITAILLLWLLRLKPSRPELVMYLLGVSALGAGLALQLQLSPLFVCMVTGAGVANLSEDRDRVFKALVKWEQPIYLILLLLAGAMLGPPTLLVVGAGVAYVLVRGVAKAVSGFAAAPVARLSPRAPASFGLSLIPQGGVTLAVAVSVAVAYQGMRLPDGADGVQLFLGAVVLGVVISELVGLGFTLRMLRAAGAIHPRVEAAIQEGAREEAQAEAVKAASPLSEPAADQD